MKSLLAIQPLRGLKTPSGEWVSYGCESGSKAMKNLATRLRRNVLRTRERLRRFLHRARMTLGGTPLSQVLELRERRRHLPPVGRPFLCRVF